MQRAEKSTRAVRESDGHGLVPVAVSRREPMQPKPAPNNSIPTPRAAGSGIYGLPFTPEDSRVVIIPVPFEATTSYGGGTSRGPAAVFEASKQVDLFDRETGKPYEQGIAMLDDPEEDRALERRRRRASPQPVIEKGGVVDRRHGTPRPKVNAIGEQMNDWVYEQTRALLDAGKIAGDPRRRSLRPVRRDPRLRREAIPASASSISTRTPICAMPTKASPGRTPRSSTT